MAHLLSYTLFSFAILSATMAFSFFQKKDYTPLKRNLFITLALSSSWWNFWYAMMIIQVDPQRGYLCRSIAMPGVFAYLIFGTLLIAQWSDLSKKTIGFITYFSYLGIIILPFNILPNSCIFFLETFGMSYKFTPGFWMNTYTFYSALIGINLIIMICSMFSKKNRRARQILAKSLLGCCIAIFIGMILDTICPILGIGAFPGSTLTQFFGIAFVYKSALFEYQNNITFDKISDIILHAFTTPVVIVNEKGRIGLINDAAERFFQLKGKKLNSLSFESFFENLSVSFGSWLDIQKIEVRTIHTQRDCSISIDTLYDDFNDILGYIIVVNDITERNRLIEDLTEARILADKANESKSIFLANMSHEIRTPINAVLGMDEMILREENLDNIRSYAQNIRTAGKTLLSIINEILDFSKIESGKMELVNENFALDAMLFDLTNSIFLRAKDKNLLLETNLDTTTPKVLFGDELRIKQILLNLLTNAVKYTDQGTIRFTMSHNKIDENKIILRFVVKDTGIGIKETDIPKLFSSFKRLDHFKNQSIEGTGLGLNIVHKLLEFMGGTIQVESIYQKGSAFTACIPITVVDWTPVGFIDIMDKSSSKFVPFKSSFVAPNASILSVDDNRINLKVFKGLLKETQIRIDAVTSGEKCLEFIQKKKYDIIFLDHMMPGMDGVETLKRMKTLEHNLSKDSPVIVLTANALNGVKETYLNYGFDDYIAKPIDYESLETTIRKLLPSELIQDN